MMEKVGILLLLVLLVGFCYGKEYEVLILGAGAAGLGAATYFHNENFNNFLILEGNDYIGGRIKNQLFEDVNLALGAAWLHKLDENHTLAQLAVKYNLKTKEDFYNLQKVIIRNADNGSRFDQSAIVERGGELNDAVDKMDTLVENRLEELGRYDIDLASGLRWAGWKTEYEFDDALTFYAFDFENAVEPDAISAYQYGMTGNDYFVTDERGYGYPLLQEITPFKNKIQLNNEITKVERISQNKYEVHIKNGTKYTAKNVLVTFSTGVLNARAVKFEPELPEWKYEALALTPMAHYCKIFLYFNESFWDNTNYFLLVKKFRGMYTIWRNTQNFVGKNILTAILTGTICKQSQQKTDQEIKTEVYNILKKVYKNATMPAGMMRNDWSNNKRFYGSFSSRVAGFTSDDYLSLEHPLKQGLWFAGEYMNGDYFGYAHGAYNQGIKIAKNMKACLENTDKCPGDTPKYTLKKTCTSSATTAKQTLLVVILMTYLGFIKH